MRFEDLPKFEEIDFPILQNIIQGICNVDEDEIRKNSRLREDLGIDNLSIIDLIEILENIYDIKISEEKFLFLSDDECYMLNKVESNIYVSEILEFIEQKISN